MKFSMKDIVTTWKEVTKKKNYYRKLYVLESKHSRGIQPIAGLSFFFDFLLPCVLMRCFPQRLAGDTCNTGIPGLVPGSCGSLSTAQRLSKSFPLALIVHKSFVCSL